MVLNRFATLFVAMEDLELQNVLSCKDPMTGLFNRRYLEETLEREISRCKRKVLPLAVFMIDIDHFKQFNDNFGHEAGDKVIQLLSNALNDFVRNEDIVCRYGGDEFIIVLSEIDLESALRRADQLHQRVSKINVHCGAVTLTQITISVGVAVYPFHGEDKHHLITAADAALYQAKNSGRNKTVLYEKED